ncbi:MAG: hypothetical protein F4034_09920 [Chloroflexi bacterium]|nr:hypothetical protein [Chloroflexota bacterium]
MTDQSREIEGRVTSFLDDIGASYEVVQIDPDFADTINFCEKYGFPIETSGNTIVVASKRGAKKHSASVVRADKRLDVNHKVCELMGIKRASFATAEETSEVTGMMLGGVACLALPPDSPIYIDCSVLEQPYVILGGGSRSTKIKADPKVLQMIPNAEIIDDLTL